MAYFKNILTKPTVTFSIFNFHESHIVTFLLLIWLTHICTRTHVLANRNIYKRALAPQKKRHLYCHHHITFIMHTHKHSAHCAYYIYNTRSLTVTVTYKCTIHLTYRIVKFVPNCLYVDCQHNFCAIILTEFL